MVENEVKIDNDSIEVFIVKDSDENVILTTLSEDNAISFAQLNSAYVYSSIFENKGDSEIIMDFRIIEYDDEEVEMMFCLKIKHLNKLINRYQNLFDKSKIFVEIKSKIEDIFEHDEVDSYHIEWQLSSNYNSIEYALDDAFKDVVSFCEDYQSKTKMHNIFKNRLSSILK